MNKYRKFSVTFACSLTVHTQNARFRCMKSARWMLGSYCNAKSSKKRDEMKWMWKYREKKHTNTHNSLAETTINTVQKDWDKNKSEIQEESK